MSHRTVAAIFFGLSVMATSALYGQSSSSAPVPEDLPTGIRRFSFGFRVAGYPFNPLKNKDENFTTSDSVPATFTIQTTNNYLKVGFGPSVEFAITRQFAVAGELFYHRLNYTKTTQITQGTLYTGITENTHATFWDVPVMLRYRIRSEEGILSHVYVAGGAALRTVSNISTNILFQHPDGTNTTSNAAIKPSVLAPAIRSTCRFSRAR